MYAFLPGAGGIGSFQRQLPRALSPIRPALVRMMSLSTGTKIDLEKSVMTLSDGAPSALSLKEVFAGKKVVMFSIPGALTPTCTDNQGPEFIAALDDLKAKGVDNVACLCVNDPFVTDVYAKKMNAVGKITFLSDGDGSLTKSLGIGFDTGGFGGIRARRGSYIVDDGVFTHVNLENGGEYKGPSTPATVLEQL